MPGKRGFESINGTDMVVVVFVCLILLDALEINAAPAEILSHTLLLHCTFLLALLRAPFSLLHSSRLNLDTIRCEHALQWIQSTPAQAQASHHTDCMKRTNNELVLLCAKVCDADDGCVGRAAESIVLPSSALP
jgi:hypothetical protein